jgi:hypothetical protein
VTSSSSGRQLNEISNFETYKSIETTNEAFSLILIIICLGAMPLLFFHYLKNNLNMYQMAKFQNSDGTLFEDIDLRNRWKAAFYLFFIFRRIVFVSIVFSMESLGAI